MGLARARGVLLVASVLLPAVGIAYLGAVSYQEDRGLVAAKLQQQFHAARAMASRVNTELSTTLDAVAKAFQEAPRGRLGRAALTQLAAQHPLAVAPFYIDATGRLQYPAPEPLAGEAVATWSSSPDTRRCPERGFDACVRVVRAARRRIQQLEQARQLEFRHCSPAASCADGSREIALVKRRYRSLARFDDTAPDALLGLARLARNAGQPARARNWYQVLSRRFGVRADRDGVSYALLAELGTAELGAQQARIIETYRKLVERGFHAPSATLGLAASRLRSMIDEDALTPPQTRSLAVLDAELGAARSEAALAEGMEGQLGFVARTAAPHPVGRPVLRGSSRTLVYRTDARGGVVGIIVEDAALERVAGASGVDLGQLGEGVEVIIDRPGGSRVESGRTRTLASASFGQTLPHLSLALVHDRSMRDPVDAIVEARGRRHLAITGGLVAVLILGIFATVRGAARARELSQLKSDFVSTVSHELKTPLTSIRMFGEMLQQGVAGTDRDREARYHAIIVKESQRLGLLIANLLDYSQIERGTLRYNQGTERVVDLAEETIETFQRFQEADGPALALHVEPAARDDAVFVDREVVVQAVLNLLENAAKYGGTEGPIEVRVARRGADRVALLVRDHGPGIPVSEQDKIFREFYRAPAAYSSGVEGTGLGLALVKRHVEAQGGAVEVDSAPPDGATFSLVFQRV